MKRFTIEMSTNGNHDVVNLTPEVQRRLEDVGGEGVIHLFVVGSTAAITTIEFENGLIREDLPALFQRLAPEDGYYAHELTWNDDNGHAHIRAALVGPSISVPFSKAKLLTGEYQQIILIDFDTRPRRRVVIGTIMTEQD